MGEKRRYFKPPSLQDSRTMTDEQWLNERFWPKVTKTETCWIWSAGPDSRRGYGRIIYQGKRHRPHRLFKAMVSGIDVEEIPLKLQACHTCDNRLCVNPDHIFWGTNKDNVKDAIKKGRFKPFGNKRAKAGYAGKPIKLTAEKVQEIRAKYRTFETASLFEPKSNCMELAKEYGVNEATIRQIIKGKIWKHV